MISAKDENPPRGSRSSNASNRHISVPRRFVVARRLLGTGFRSLRQLVRFFREIHLVLRSLFKTLYDVLSRSRFLGSRLGEKDKPSRSRLVFGSHFGGDGIVQTYKCM